jgi:RNA polymerase sigma-70 factor, ECF subfamily
VSSPSLPQSSAYGQFLASAKECESALYARALRLTKNPADARDLVQDAFERGFRALDRFEPGTNLRLWLLRILVNLFLDRCRKKSRGPAFESLTDQVASSRAADEEPEPAWASITPEQFAQALNALDPLFREPYLLRVQRGLSYDLIAKQLDLPMGTVATRIARARTKLRHLLLPLTGSSNDSEREGTS